MKKFNLALASVLAFSLALPAFAGGTKKSKLNTNLYEEDSKDSTVSGKIKAVREVQGDTEVFIDNPQRQQRPLHPSGKHQRPREPAKNSERQPKTRRWLCDNEHRRTTTY